MAGLPTNVKSNLKYHAGGVKYDEIWQYEVFYATQRKYSLMTHS